MLMRAFSLTLGQIGDPVFRGVLIKSILFTLILFVGLTLLFYWAAPEVKVFESDWLQWLNGVLEVGGGLAFFALLVLTFSATATLIGGIFLDDIAEAVEKRHYAGDPEGQSADFPTTFAVSIRFIGITILLNILALPLYLIALLFPPLFACIFYGLNGYLLSREYFELVSLRHQDAKVGRQLRKANRTKVFLAGVIIAFFITIPIVNLVVPILATAFMLHIFKALQTTQSTEIVS
ncbi:MAG: EI24 domain-containing protein [Alphaproteobacteria bacterium]|nr:EI24 domain-containing protein [Alphaproteobacteria bacterium]